jgi:hypothetical protein
MNLRSRPDDPACHRGIAAGNLGSALHRAESGRLIVCLCPECRPGKGNTSRVTRAAEQDWTRFHSGSPASPMCNTCANIMSVRLTVETQDWSRTFSWLWSQAGHQVWT